MSSGMEEKDDPGKHITLEAMSGLSKVLLYLDKKNVQLLVVYIFMKIKPFLESENDEIRCASIMLLGNLSKFGSGEPVFKDQIHNVLVSLLLHLSDPNLQVVKVGHLTSTLRQWTWETRHLQTGLMFGTVYLLSSFLCSPVLYIPRINLI
uniref:Maestro/Maestro-like HEAT-repeats domain-containing protein n=1 Tax=Hucho hucho TaxID=62062 RepID=A0A4W5KMP5_9TELE